MWSNTYWHVHLLSREENGKPLLYSCLEDSMDTGPLGATVYGVTKCQMWLSDSHTHTHTHTELLSSVWVFVTPKTVAPKLLFSPLPLLHGFVPARTLEWVPFPPLGDLPDPGLNLSLLHSKQILYCCSNEVAP